MIRVLFFALLCVFAPTIFANTEAPGCWPHIIKGFDDEPFAPNFNECVADKGKEELAYLCSNDLSQPSAKLILYLEHFDKYYEAFARYQDTQIGHSTATGAQMELRSTEMDWNLYGYKMEVGIPLLRLKTDIQGCQ